MDPDLRETLEAIHASPYQAVIVCAGAGGRAIEQLVALPGSSRTVLEAVIPYSRGAFAAFLGREPEQFTTAEMARELAERAYERACRWAESGARPLGVACTATLATTRPKRGDHRAFIALRDERAVTTWELVLSKGARDRFGEEEVVSTLLLEALAEACGVAAGGRATSDERPTTNDQRPATDGGARSESSTEAAVPSSLVVGRSSFVAASPGEAALLPTEALTIDRREIASPLSRLLASEAPFVLVLPDGQMRAEFPTPAALFPGAFNPLHVGHLGLARVAARRLGVPVTFELSATNVDKPPLSEAEIRRRLAQFAARHPVAVTDAPTFVRKARLFPGALFLIGADTLERLFVPRYYGGEAEMLAAIAEIDARGCRFLVAGRHYDDAYRASHEIPIPPPFRALFDFISEEEFRADISSTQLRR
jgi:hypothetical protein